MLGNNADAFFTTPMKTTVIRGGNASTRNEMPAPWGASPSRGFLPMGADPAAQIAADTKKFLGMTLPVLGLVAGAAFLFLTEPGARLRAKIGF